jgi:hypothetical protein
LLIKFKNKIMKEEKLKEEITKFIKQRFNKSPEYIASNILTFVSCEYDAPILETFLKYKKEITIILDVLQSYKESAIKKSDCIELNDFTKEHAKGEILGLSRCIDMLRRLPK